MRSLGSVLLVLTTLGVAAAPSAAALSFSLSDAEQAEAIGAGRHSITSETFGAEWTVRDASGQTLTVITPYYRLALAARNAAFKGTDLTPREIASVLKDAGARLVLRVTLRGPRSDFARFIAPTLSAGKAEIRPAFVQNERVAVREDDGRYTAQCVYAFPAQGLTGRERVTLVVRDADREAARFTVDLSAMP